MLVAGINEFKAIKAEEKEVTKLVTNWKKGGKIIKTETWDIRFLDRENNPVFTIGINKFKDIQKEIEKVPGLFKLTFKEKLLLTAAIEIAIAEGGVIEL